MGKKRFEIIYTQGTVAQTEILVDKATGVNYLFHWTINNVGGLTPLIDKDGKPVVTPIDEE